MVRMSLGRTTNRWEAKTMGLQNGLGQLARRLAGLAVMLAAVWMICVPAAWAQVPTGSITGTVKDAQGLPIEGVTVTLTNQETSATFTSVTASAGGYQFEHIDYGL